ncbi:dehydrogenase [Nitzschia inconspicua]|uniref:Dehydrogenase n=1 Tax=Nitzschia inconspicua TaxID=303405 RepID=A0A9K3KXN4_9STRA|nr:dehydrogenase [Nitzschia inconspicua]
MSTSSISVTATTTQGKDAVKTAVGLWVAKNFVLAVTGIFSPKNNGPTRQIRGKEQTKKLSFWRRTHPADKIYKKGRAPTNVKKQSIATTPPATPSSSPVSWKRRVTTATMSILGVVYVLYPTSLLLLFRVSEQISWIRLFQNYHSCRMGNITSCIPVGLVQLTQIVASVGTFAYFRALWKGKLVGISSIGKGLALYVLFWAVVVAIMKISVDEVELYHPPQNDDNLLSGKVAVITGANRGIGLATAQWMALRGAHVVVTCRSIAKCQPVVDEINRSVQHGGTTSTGSASAVVLDLSSLRSAKALVESISRNFPNGIHYLFCNAGTTPQYPLTEEGFEDGFGGMHLAHMAVALGLLPLLKKGADTQVQLQSKQGYSRIIMVSSEMSINAAMGIFGPLETMFSKNNLRGEITRGDGTLATSMPAYGRAKLCNVLLALELNRQMKDMGWPVIANAVHTGAVVTDSSRNSIKQTFEGVFPGLSWVVGNIYFPLLWRNVDGGARTLLCAALSEDHVSRGGQYLDALCRAFLPESTTERDLSPQNIIPISLGAGKTMEINLDAVQALLTADAKYSSFLWDVSVEILRDSPSRQVVDFRNTANLNDSNAKSDDAEGISR